MTHQIVEAVAARLNRARCEESPYHAKRCRGCRLEAADIVAEVLRLAQEPSEGMTQAIGEALPSAEDDFRNLYRAGIAALRREVTAEP